MHLHLSIQKQKEVHLFRFNIHIEDIGHSAIVGPTGYGKSVLLGLIASSFMKYKDSRVYFFDKDASSRVLTYAVGGEFHDLGNDELSFQPLANIEIVEEKRMGLWLDIRNIRARKM